MDSKLFSVREHTFTFPHAPRHIQTVAGHPGDFLEPRGLQPWPATILSAQWKLRDGCLKKIVGIKQGAWDTCRRTGSLTWRGGSWLGSSLFPQSPQNNSMMVTRLCHKLLSSPRQHKLFLSLSNVPKREAGVMKEIVEVQVQQAKPRKLADKKVFWHAGLTRGKAKH